MPHYVATLRVLVEADSEAGATDGISELLRESQATGDFLVDWTYHDSKSPVTPPADPILPGGDARYCGPVEVTMPEQYQEGDLLDIQYRCNHCGGLVTFDGTPPKP